MNARAAGERKGTTQGVEVDGSKVGSVAALLQRADQTRKPPPNQHRRPWIWIWWAYFCHPPPKWYHAASVTTLNPPEFSSNQNLERWANHVLFFPAGHGIQLSVNPTLFRGPDGEVMTPTSFIDASKRRHAFVFPPIIPEGHQKIFSLTEQRWKS
ncbi:BQ2448_4295 [Microbotryum intermedium]|uniref:BQ2448_4295 protein n=1 Tax=Microbotryum intermedium TaxID=269621 RepID=A0A238FNI1_9BASI|nr:BQ2448_4295 [Microbotryum intermedium]